MLQYQRAFVSAVTGSGWQCQAKWPSGGKEVQDHARFKELEIQDRSSRYSHGWLVSNTVHDCLQRQIAQKILKLKIEVCPVNADHYMSFKHYN